jgi:HlyD family secretion protein
MIAAAAVVIGCGALAAYAWRSPAATPPVAGMVRQTEIRIAPDASGRLSSLAARPGQRVRKGETLAVLDNPDLAASVSEAKAASASARADRDRVYAGPRAEEVAIAAQDVQAAEANLILAQQQTARAAALASRDFGSRQQLDERIATLRKASSELDLRRAQHEAAVAGPTAEERATADAKVTLAEAALADLEAAWAKTSVVAPQDGVVGIQVAELGEVVGPGKPILTLDVVAARWLAFTLREDGLQGIAVGKTVALATADGRHFEARITELRPLGEFATWRAARAVGDHDLNAFWVRLDPLSPVDGLEPGMTVWLPGRS